jgi:hypothetical protein
VSAGPAAGRREEPVTVLYIASVPHSGSTILSGILGSVEGLFAAGELFYVSHCLDRGIPCGCGLHLRECPLWRGVLASGFGSPEQALERLRPEHFWLLARSLPVLLARGRVLPRAPALAAYPSALAELYRAIRERTGCRVVVDSSKSPSYAYLLERSGAVDLRVVHLVRDPRATAFSWRRARNRLDVHPTTFGLLWAYWNAAIRRLWGGRRGRYLLLRYEDFARDPQGAVRRVLELAGEAAGGLPFAAADVAVLEAGHQLGGNWNTSPSGPTPLRPDEEWRERTSPAEALLTTCVTWPVQRRYGYPLRSRPLLRRR